MSEEVWDPQCSRLPKDNSESGHFLISIFTACLSSLVFLLAFTNVLVSNHTLIGPDL